MITSSEFCNTRKVSTVTKCLYGTTYTEVCILSKGCALAESVSSCKCSCSCKVCTCTKCLYSAKLCAGIKLYGSSTKVLCSVECLILSKSGSRSKCLIYTKVLEQCKVLVSGKFCFITKVCSISKYLIFVLIVSTTCQCSCCNELS